MAGSGGLWEYWGYPRRKLEEPKPNYNLTFLPSFEEQEEEEEEEKEAIHFSLQYIV